MRLSVMLEAQEGMTYADLLAVARRAETAGFAGVYRSDHYSNGQGREPLGSTDAWATLAGLAVQTAAIRLGTLVSPATFRPVGNLAKVAATVAEMAGVTPDGGSRVALGMGTGWMEIEHLRHGFAFGDADTRFRRLEEQLEVLTRFWDPQQQPFDYHGEFTTTADTWFLPVPEPRPRIIVGGRGMRRTPALAARYADELNGVLLSPAQCRRQRAAVDAACRDAGRDPATVRYSLMTRCVVGATEAEFRERAARLQRRSGVEGSLDDYLAGFDPSWLTGTPQRVRRVLDEFADAGVEEVMLQHLLFDDLDMLDVVAEHLS